MKLLLDTHALLWFDWDHAKLSTEVSDLMADGGWHTQTQCGHVMEGHACASLRHATPKLF